MRRTAPILWALLALPVLSSTSEAQTDSDVGSRVTITLSTGEQLTGTLLELDAVNAVLEHPVLGRLVVPRVSIKPPEPAAVVEPKSPWSGSLDVALNGSRGNNQQQTFYTSFKAQRDTEKVIDTYLATYNQAQSEVEVVNPNPPTATYKTTDKSADRFFAEARREWRLEDTKWRPFLQGSLEIDEFKDYNYRVAAFVGGAYPLIDEEDQKLTSRLGLGTSHEVGGEDNGYQPEALLALDYQLQIDEQQRFVAGVEVFPILDDLLQNRNIIRAQYEAQFNPDDPWRFITGVERAEDTDPNPGDSKIDVTYFMGLGYTF